MLPVHAQSLASLHLASLGSYLHEATQLGWLLFLHLKPQLLGKQQDLMG
jgi:hypothetical protein